MIVRMDRPFVWPGARRKEDGGVEGEEGEVDMEMYVFAFPEVFLLACCYCLEEFAAGVWCVMIGESEDENVWFVYGY
jgi:hypothetical protein